MSILTAGGGTGSQGDIVDITDTISGTGSTTVTITDASILGASAKVKFIGTVTKTSVTPRLKTTNLLKQVKVVASDDDGAFGVRDDKEISLGRADVLDCKQSMTLKIQVQMHLCASMTISNITGTFQRGEKIVGGNY